MTPEYYVNGKPHCHLAICLKEKIKKQDYNLINILIKYELGIAGIDFAKKKDKGKIASYCTKTRLFVTYNIRKEQAISYFEAYLKKKPEHNIIYKLLKGESKE